MKLSELRKIYANACAGCNRPTSDDQLDSWRKILGTFEERELSAALAAWQGDTGEVMISDSPRCRGSLMPTAADLKALMMRARNKVAAANRFTPCGLDGCSDGLKLIIRDDRRFVVNCECLNNWKQKRTLVQGRQQSGWPQVPDGKEMAANA